MKVILYGHLAKKYRSVYDIKITRLSEIPEALECHTYGIKSEIKRMQLAGITFAYYLNGELLNLEEFDIAAYIF
ncbi:hypothetical protein ACFP2G_08400, partial [Psittacicella hinzii]